MTTVAVVAKWITSRKGRKRIVIIRAFDGRAQTGHVGLVRRPDFHPLPVRMISLHLLIPRMTRTRNCTVRIFPAHTIELPSEDLERDTLK